MPLSPEFGETLVSAEELEALTDEARSVLGSPVHKADVYDLEQLVQQDVTEDLLGNVLDGALTVQELLSDHFVRDLHARLYGAIWRWGGRQRNRETNIGIAPEQISVETRNALDNLRYRWEHDRSLSPRALGVSAHAELVRIHPFIDGNGRTTRLLADLLFIAAQTTAELLVYDWEVNRGEYIRLLGQYDQTRDADPLIELVPVVSISEGE